MRPRLKPLFLSWLKEIVDMIKALKAFKSLFKKK